MVGCKRKVDAIFIFSYARFCDANKKENNKSIFIEADPVYIVV